jgi:nicotinamidase-related amidase
MTTTNGSTEHHRAVIGNADHFWLYSSRTGFDLTCPSQACPAPSSPPIRIETTTSPITIDATKSALVIIDMQNYFLSEALGRSRGAGHAALDQLTEYAIPACRKAGIRILWVNWGLTEADVEDMPPSIKRLFGFQAVVDDGLGQAAGCGFGVDKHGMKARAHEGMGSEMGSIRAMETGAEVDAGRVLMRGSWNAGLYPPLDKIYDEGTKLEVRPDVWLHKNRLSGMRPGSELERFLEKEGLRTLFFVSFSIFLKS